MKPFGIIVPVLCLVGCSTISRIGPQQNLEGYEGEVSIELTVRQHGLVGVTCGYALKPPSFLTDASSQEIRIRFDNHIYSLSLASFFL
jgi:hypothetical protein